MGLCRKYIYTIYYPTLLLGAFYVDAGEEVGDVKERADGVDCFVLHPFLR